MANSPKKIAFVDLETTGLDPFKHEIIEIGLVIYDVEKGTLEELNFKIRPMNIAAAEPKALEVNGYTESGWKNALPLRAVLQEVSSRCSGAYFLAYNATFDWSFLEAAYEKTRLPIPCHYHRLCIMSMAWCKIPKVKVEGYSLKTVCVYLGIEPEPKVHRALNGAKKAFEVYMALSKI